MPAKLWVLFTCENFTNAILLEITWFDIQLLAPFFLNDGFGSIKPI